MHRRLELLLESIESGLLPAPGFPILAPGESVEALLDARDGELFDRRWVAEAEAFGQLPEGPAASTVNDIAEVAFKWTLAMTDNTDLAGYVSGDFELLACALAQDSPSRWLAAMLAEYAAGRFPAGSLREDGETLVALADRILT